MISSPSLSAVPRTAKRALVRGRGQVIAAGKLFGVLVTLLWVLAPGTALAKTPRFVIEVSDGSPIVGERLQVTVRFGDRTMSDDLAEQIDGLVGAFPAGTLRLSEEVPVSLRRVGPNVYAGEVVFPTQGRWRLWSFPHLAHRDGIDEIYTDFIDLEVVTSPDSSLLSSPVTLVGAALVALGCAGFSRGRNRASDS